MPRQPIAWSAVFATATASAPSASALKKSVWVRRPPVMIRLTSEPAASRCRRALVEPADLGDSPDHLGAGKMPARTGLGSLAELEVEGLDVVDPVERPTESSRCELVHVPAVLLTLLRQHPALAGTDGGAGTVGSSCQGDLGLLGDGAEAHVGHEQRDLESKWSLCSGPDDDLGLHLVAVEQRPAGELCRDDLDRVPRWQLALRDSHRHDTSVVADVREAVARQLPDLRHVGLIGCSVCILVGALVRTPIERLRIRRAPRCDLLAVDHDVVVLDPGVEPFEALRRVVGADAGAVPVVPTVQPADQVVTAYLAVAQERAAVMAPPVQHRVLVMSVAVADDDEVDVVDDGADRTSFGESTPTGEGD